MVICYSENKIRRISKAIVTIRIQLNIITVEGEDALKDTVFHMTYRPAMEFLYAFVYSAQDEFLSEVKKLKGMTDLSVADCLVAINQRLSDYHKNEIRFLVCGGENPCDGIAQDITMAVLKRAPEIITEQQLITCLKELPAATIAQIMFSSAVAMANRLEDYEKITDSSKMIQIVSKLPLKKKRKEVYLYCIEHKEEVKERLCMAMQSFYEKAYCDLYAGVEQKARVAMKQYEQELKLDAESFSHKYHSSGIDAYDKNLYIHLSYTKMIGSDLYTSHSEVAQEWMVLGMYTQEYLMTQENGEDVTGFLKLIADKKRTQLLMLLKKQPAFVNEIADALNMTAPTASYHLTALQQYEIVDFERVEHRLYYHLNHEKLEEWFDKAKAYYLK